MTLKTYQHKSRGLLVETSDDSADPVLYFPQGGGFQRQMPRADFHTLFKTADAPVMRRGTVTADFLPEGVALPCWSDGRAWNGWGMPYFDGATVRQLIELDIGPMKWEGNNVVCQMGDDAEDIEEYKPETAPDGTPIWGIGAGSWCWDSVEFG